jgi:phage portal protein BeeE
MLLGQSPIVAAAKDIVAGDVIMTQQLNLYLNAARPSSVLTTDMVLDKNQVTALRDRWNEQVRGLNTGGTPILTAGLRCRRVSGWN